MTLQCLNRWGFCGWKCLDTSAHTHTPTHTLHKACGFHLKKKISEPFDGYKCICLTSGLINKSMQKHKPRCYTHIPQHDKVRHRQRSIWDNGEMRLLCLSPSKCTTTSIRQWDGDAASLQQPSRHMQGRERERERN